MSGVYQAMSLLLVACRVLAMGAACCNVGSYQVR